VDVAAGRSDKHRSFVAASDPVVTDERTIAVYDARAADYARMVLSAKPDKDLVSFMNALPQGARVLDLGCGPGTASAHMRAAGFDPDPVDASAAMVALARDSFALPARQGRFDDLDAIEAYDGIWANFSLLHAARKDLPRHLAAITTALRPDGLFHIGMKTGSGTTRDSIDRLYTFVTVDELRDLLTEAGLNVTAWREGSGPGLAGTDDPFVIMTAGKPANA